MGWWRRSWAGPWPGHGPFAYLPPWERPGWTYWAAVPVYDRESELRSLQAYRLYLEDLRSWLDEELRAVDKRISELKSGQQA
ncbi:DUF5320 domain-containing protein [Acidilobus sp. 7A]|uniref:DUF5320 domain-containing protein n=1 Tax=Acidilobus sp. 7A TaxID=1577685 RepID=UPI000764D600|nr:DUF5320 domain-containing protein [Acidilobus sp. 7A]AMD30245.1 hypothetical protein SE86_01110 [Acidilobus sp. 7A]